MTKLICKARPLRMEAFSSIPIDVGLDVVNKKIFIKLDFDNHKGQLEFELFDYFVKMIIREYYKMGYHDVKKFYCPIKEGSK